MAESHREEILRDLSRVMGIIHCGLLALDEQGRILLVNERLLSWLGYSAREIEGRPVGELVPAEVREIVQSEIAAGRTGDQRLRMTVLRRRDSTTFPVVVIPHRLLDAEEQVWGSFALLVDLGAVQTAKSAGYPLGGDVRASLERIALELQALSLSADLPATTAVPLHHPALAELSPREKEILTQLVGAGERVPSIAEELCISQHTVRSHLKAIFGKLGVRDQSELIRFVRALED